MNRNQKVNCMICMKSMRSDKLKQHTRTHQDLLSLPEEEVKKELRARHNMQLEREAKRKRIEEIAAEEELSIPQEVKAVKSNDKETVRNEMLMENEQYKAKIELGRIVADIIDEENINEESLSREKQESLLLFRKQQPQFNISEVELRSWQQDAMKYFDSPSERQVIWIRGNNGNEGKTWFQKYVQSFFGYHRVFRSDLRIKHTNICNILKKRTLGTIDIFLFNDTRSVSGEDINLYRILEDIKDGQATTSKYDNENIRFKTPNTVIIFSNHYPDLKKLSRDRWILLHPNKDGLKDVLNLYKKLIKNGKERAKENFDVFDQ